MIVPKDRIFCKKHLWPVLFCMACLALSILPGYPAAGSPGKKTSTFRRMPLGLRPYAIALGQRLQKPGKEKITATGTIFRPENLKHPSDSIRITWQYPMKLRLDKDNDSLTYERNSSVHASPADQETSETVQMLLEDSMEGLFAIQKDRLSRVHLGSGFALEDAGASDPAMDIVMISYPDVFKRRQPITKSYWFDSRTKLLGVVAYTSASGASVHVVINDWREVGGEQIPFCIERWENNKLVMRLNLESAAVSAGDNTDTSGGN